MSTQSDAGWTVRVCTAPKLLLHCWTDGSMWLGKVHSLCSSFVTCWVHLLMHSRDCIKSVFTCWHSQFSQWLVSDNSFFRLSDRWIICAEFGPLGLYPFLMLYLVVLYVQYCLCAWCHVCKRSLAALSSTSSEQGRTHSKAEPRMSLPLNYLSSWRVSFSGLCTWTKICTTLWLWKGAIAYYFDGSRSKLYPQGCSFGLLLHRYSISVPIWEMIHGFSSSCSTIDTSIARWKSASHLAQGPLTEG